MTDTLLPTVHGFGRGSQKSHVTQHCVWLQAEIEYWSN